MAGSSAAAASYLDSVATAASPSKPGGTAWLAEQFDEGRAGDDLALFRLRVEAAISPAVDPTRGIALLNAMASDLLNRLPSGLSPTLRLSALRRYLYEPGAWNSHRPIRYDLPYALDGDARHGFLHKLLTKRLGNCVSMPLLFVALGHRLKMPMTLAQAPNHVFVVHTDPVSGQDVWLEATSGAHPIRLQSMRRAMPMTDQAIAQGIYLRKLTHHECMALLAMPLLQPALHERKDRLLIQLADVLLRYAPHNVDAMLAKGSAFAVRMERDFEKKYPNPIAMPRDVRASYEQAHRQNLHWFQRAEALGWREPDPESESRYRRHIEELLKQSGRGSKP